MQMTSLWPALLSPDQPCLLHFHREPQSAVMHGRASRATPPQIEIPVPFLACIDNDRIRTFVDIETEESWAQITKTSSSPSEDLTDVLSVPSLGITQLPVSRFLDDMDGLYGERRAFRMRTPYGAHTWFRAAGAPGTTVLECKHPPPEEEHYNLASSLLQAFASAAQGASGTPPEVFQPPHFNADPDFHARWPFHFNLKVIYRAADDFSLEIVLSDILPDASIVEEPARALRHAAIIAVFVMNDAIHAESPRADPDA